MVTITHQNLACPTPELLATSAAMSIRRNALRKTLLLWSRTDHLTPKVIGKNVEARNTFKL